MDEVAVWNRQLDAEEIHSAMMHMPSFKSARQLEAPRGIPLDLASGRVMWSRFNNPCTDRTGAADEGGYTSGVRDGNTGDVSVTDTDDDLLTWIDFKTHTKYAYTGVPWAEPYINSVSSSFDPMQMDGGTSVTVSGIGFANSPFLKCLATYDTGEPTPSPSDYNYYYASDEFTTKGDGSVLHRVTTTPAMPKVAYDSQAEYLSLSSLSHPSNSASRAAAWDAAGNADLREGKIPVFESSPEYTQYQLPDYTPNYHDEIIYGYWEVVTCTSPSVGFPSNLYDLSVSNDAGISIANAMDVSFSEYAVSLSGVEELGTDGYMRGKTFSVWFMLDTESLLPATVFSLSNGLGFYYEDGIIEARYGVQSLASLGNVTALSEWHHVAMVIDGGDLSIYMDAVDLAAHEIPDLDYGYSLQTVGTNLVGKVDELKIFEEALSAEELMRSMFRRETDLGAMGAYYRFNGDIIDATGLTVLEMSGSDDPQFVSVGAPWEPMTVSKVNGVPVEDIPRVGLAGDMLRLEGYNFAPSQWFQCHFGDADEAYTIGVAATNATTDACELVTSGDLDRPVGPTQDLGTFDVYTVSGGTTTASYASLTEASCPGVDVTIDARIVDFGLGEGMIHPVELGMSETALECVGTGEYAIIDNVIDEISGSEGFTVSLWIYPYASNELRNTQSDNYAPLLNYVEAGQPIAGGESVAPILAIQSSTGDTTKTLASILYDRATGRVIYYDDQIHSVNSKADVMADAWHHVVLSILPTGDGVLSVDDHSEPFTSTTQIDADGKIHLCASLEGDAHYSGLIDDVTFYNVFIAPEAAKSNHHIDAEHKGLISGTVAYFPMDRKYLAVDNADATLNGTVGDADGTMVNALRAISTGPWQASDVFQITPEGGSLIGGTKVTIEGLNFAITDYIHVKFGTTEVQADSVSSNKIVVTSPPGECLSSVPVSVVNSNIHPSQDIGGEMFSYHPSMDDLAFGLVSYYPMYVPRYARNATHGTLFDVIGGRNGSVAVDALEIDRNGVASSAIAASSMALPPPSSYLGPSFTICMWTRIGKPGTAIDVAGIETLFGAWKFVCSLSNRGYYVNSMEASAAESVVLDSMFSSLYNTGYIDHLALAIDDLWIYSREIAPCEMLARYYTSESSVDFSASGPAHVTIEAQGEIAAVFGGLEAWVHLHAGDGISTVASASDGSWSVGIEDGNVFLSVANPSCSCSDGCYERYLSAKANVIPGQWVHVAVSYESQTSFYYVDGVLVDKAVFSTTIAPEPLLTSALLGRAPANPVTGHEDVFNGEINSIVFRSKDDFDAFSVKSGVFCPRSDMEIGGASIANFGLNEGSGNLAYAFTADAELVTYVKFPGVAVWQNASYDDTTDLEATTINLDGFSEWNSSETVYFAMTSRTACGKMRSTGGESFAVTFTHQETSTVYFGEVVDTDDGNYHVLSTMTCGAYDVAVTSGSTDVATFNVSVFAEGASPEMSYVTVPTEEQCFGSPFTFEITALDDSGCVSDSGNDEFVVDIMGPHSVSASVTYLGEGKYEAAFVPLASGKYYAALSLKQGDAQVPLATPSVCLDVCYGGSLFLDGASGFEIDEDGLTVNADMSTDLDISSTSSGTLKAWVKPAAASDKAAYIIHKGAGAETVSGQNAKGYSLRLSSDYTVLEASMYLGLGEIATVDANVTMTPTVWSHVAFTYAGQEMKLYVNGELVGEATHVGHPLKNAVNLYPHPLSVGYGFVGEIDEVMILGGAQSQSAIQASSGCPPIAGDFADVILYLPFNGYTVTNTSAPGYGRDCLPGSVKSMAGGCMDGYFVGNATLAPASSPLDPLNGVPGAGTPGATYSTIKSDISTIPSMHAAFTIRAKDVCGFAYQAGAADAYGVEAQYEEEVFISSDAPVPEYPINVVGEKLYFQAQPHGEASTCYASVPHAGTYVAGDVYAQAMALNDTGKYALQVVTATDSGPVVSTVVEAVVPAAVHVLDGDKSFVGGVTSTLRIEITDAVGNVIAKEGVDLVAAMTLVGQPYSANIPVDMQLSAETSTYLLRFELMPVQGSHYTLVFTSGGAKVATTPGIILLSVDDSEMRSVVSSTSEGVGNDYGFRFGHSAVLHDHSLYFWGGAGFGTQYLSDMLVLENVGKSVHSPFLYQKRITLGQLNPAPAMAGPVPVSVTVNTQELVMAGRLLPDCADVMFAIQGSPLYFYLDPHPGCNDTATRFVVRMEPAHLAGISTGPVVVHMLYGNQGMGEAPASNAFMDPTEVFAFYEDFEGGDTGTLGAADPCSLAAAQDGRGAFAVSTAFSKYGARSLHAAPQPKDANAEVLVAGLPAATRDFHMRAWFWDSNAAVSAHFISPNLGGMCGATLFANASTATAVGTYTSCHASKLCVASPWEESGAGRSAEWKRLDIVSTQAGGFRVSIDGVLSKQSDEAISADKVLISAGRLASAAQALDAPSHAYWDEISFLALPQDASLASLFLDADAVAVVADAMALDAPVVSAGIGDATASWRAPMHATSPPPRYGHSAVTYGGAMFVYAGERHAYKLSDVWAFDFATEAWRFVDPGGATLPAARVAHAAAVLPDGRMVVHGGKGADNRMLGDLWAMDLSAAVPAWSPIAPSTAAGARSGHTATALAGRLYLFGGASDTEASFFFSCDPNTGACDDITHGCGAGIASGKGPAAEATPTPADVGLGARYGHIAVAAGGALYVHGGVDVATGNEPGGLFRFDVDACAWEEVLGAAGSAGLGSGAGVHDHAAAASEDAIYVFGGLRNGRVLESAVLAYPL